MLEARYIWGDQALFDEVTARFRQEIATGDVGARSSSTTQTQC